MLEPSSRDPPETLACFEYFLSEGSIRFGFIRIRTGSPRSLLTACYSKENPMAEAHLTAGMSRLDIEMTFSAPSGSLRRVGFV